VPFSTLQARAFQTAWAAHSGVPMSARNSLGMKLLLMPPGKFRMGTTDEQLAVLRAQVLAVDPTVSDEKFAEFRREQPPHEVTLTKPFYLAEHEVTLGQFRTFIAATGHRPDSETSGAKGWKGVKESLVFETAFNWRNPGYDVTDQHPVGSVTWNDAVLFCNWLSRQEGLPVCYENHITLGWIRSGIGGYRLPTEAEWEFACRAGTTSLWPWGDSGYTVKGSSEEIKKFATIYRDERTGQMAPVGTMPPNAFGLHDMIGNVGEWCQDWYAVDYSHEAAAATDPQGPNTASNRTYRGLASSGYYMRPAFRGGVSMPEHRIGFRIARDLAATAARPAK
jgi:formylglycine-generating enzyme required for sulfatase activity